MEAFEEGFEDVSVSEKVYEGVYITYAVFDIVFAFVTLYRFVWTIVVCVRLRKRNQQIFSPGDDSTPLMQSSSDYQSYRENKPQGFDYMPKLCFYGLTGATCTLCVYLHVVMIFPDQREEVADSSGTMIKQYNIIQLMTDAFMTISYGLVAIAFLDQFIFMFSLQSSSSENAYNQTVGTEKKGFCQFLLTMKYKGPILTFFVFLVVFVVIILLVAVPNVSRHVVVLVEHILMSTLVFLAYVILLIVSCAFSVVLKKVHQSQSLALQLRKRILGFCLPAAVVGILRYPFDILVANNWFTLPSSPYAFIISALVFRYVPATLITILMWPLPSVKKQPAAISSIQQQLMSETA